jgi:YidC/Oxa1 family membrane protein insertase
VNLFDVIIVQPILNLLMAIYAIVPGGDFGISIVIFTIIIRFLLWPLVKKAASSDKSDAKDAAGTAKTSRKTQKQQASAGSGDDGALQAT